jgi:hypothetical protein
MRTTIACFLLLLAACVSREVSQIPFSAAPRPPAGMALVYLFRSNAEAGAFDVPTVIVDGKPVLALHAAEYTAIQLPAGPHTVRTDSYDPSSYPASRALAFTLAPGQVAALALEFSGLPRPQTGYYLETKQGKMQMPDVRAPSESPFAWTFVSDIEASALAAELRKRRFRAPGARELAAG